MALLQHCVLQTSVKTGIFLSEPLQQFASEALLEHLQDDRMVGLFRLGQEEMHMLGHDHISDDDNSVADSRLFEDAQKEVATLRRAQQLDAAGNN
jgi:hypothetical protein